jgi:hypothetical protein
MAVYRLDKLVLQFIKIKSKAFCLCNFIKQYLWAYFKGHFDIKNRLQMLIANYIQYLTML